MLSKVTRIAAMLIMIVIRGAVFLGSEISMAEQRRTVYFCVRDEHGNAVTNLNLDIRGNPPAIEEYYVVWTDSEGYCQTNLLDGVKYDIHRCADTQRGCYIDTNILLKAGMGETRERAILLKVKTSRRLKGKVIDADGKPVSGMHVNVAVESWKGNTVDSGHVVTDNEGRFSISVCAEGEKVIIVYGRKHGGYITEELKLAPTDHDGIVLHSMKDPRPTVMCRILDGVQGGTNVLRYDGSCFIKGPTRYRVDVRNGEMVLPHMLFGKHRALCDVYEQCGMYITNEEFEVKRDTRRVDFVAMLPPETVFVVEDKKSGKRISGVALHLHLDVESGDVPLRTVETDENGEVRIRVPPWEDISVTINEERYYEERRRSEKWQWGGTNVILVGSYYTLSGRVKNVRGEVVKDAEVIWVSSDGDEKGVKTDGDGKFTLFGVSPVRGMLVVEAKGYSRKSIDVDVRKRKWVDVVVEDGIEVSFTVDVRVDKVKGVGFNEGKVILFEKGRWVPVAGIVDRGRVAGGTFRVSPGVYEVVWVNMNMAFKVKEIELKKSGKVHITIEKPQEDAMIDMKSMLPLPLSNEE